HRVNWFDIDVAGAPTGRGFAQPAAPSNIFGFDVRVMGAPAGANDIHLIFANTGGSVANRTPVSPAVQTFPPKQPTNGIDASFGALTAGATYEARFTENEPPGLVTFSSGFWTINGRDVGAINARNVRLTIVSSAVPEGSATLLLLGIGLGGLSWFGRH